MNIFRFMLRKDVKRMLLVSIGLSLLSIVFLLFSCRDMYAFEQYSSTFQSFSQSENPYESVSQKLSETESDSVDVMTEINEFTMSNLKPGEPPAVIPDELVSQLLAPLEQTGKYGGTESDDRSMLTIMLTQLESQNRSGELIENRVRGYTRNARRGVRDIYSLDLSEHLIDEYTDVLSYQETVTGAIDTRAADAFVDYMSEEILLTLGLYILLFYIFSSELQSGRFRSFAITKAGARKFTANKLITGYCAAVIFTVIYYMSAFAAMLIINTDGSLLSAPIQYLSGFELSSETMTVGEYILMVFVLKLLYALFISSVIMLVSMLSRKTIVAGTLSLGLIILLKVAAPNLSQSLAGMIFSCSFINMTGDINYIDLLTVPVKIYYLYGAVTILCTAAITGIVCVLSGKRGM